MLQMHVGHCFFQEKGMCWQFICQSWQGRRAVSGVERLTGCVLKQATGQAR